jgi:histidinol-phosphate aminotransferase
MEVMLENFEWMKQGYENIASYREDMLVELDKFEEFRVFDSKANFVLIKTKKESSFYFNKLKEKKILIKDFGITKGLENCLRITVGSKEENAILLNALKEIAR